MTRSQSITASRGDGRRAYVFTDGKGYVADHEVMTPTEAARRNAHAEHFAGQRPNASELRWVLATPETATVPA